MKIQNKKYTQIKFWRDFASAGRVTLWESIGKTEAGHHAQIFMQRTGAGISLDGDAELDAPPFMELSILWADAGRMHPWALNKRKLYIKMVRVTFT